MTTKISVYNLDSSITNAIGSGGGGPKIQTIVYPGDDTAVNTAGGDTVFLNGSGFVSGCSVVINGNTAGSVTFNSSSNVAFTAPAAATGGYPIYLVNPDGGTAIAVPGLQYSGVPTWSTAAGSLGSVYETTAFANTVVASGDAQITYSVYSGSLPTGASLNSLSGTISGNSVVTASSTTYNFTIRATDAQQQDSDRAFSLTVNPDVVTWSSPANNVTYNIETETAISNVSLSATSAVGYGVQYSANTLPTGLTLSGNTISGTPTVVGNTNTLVTATANTTSRTTQQIINWVVSVGADTYMPYVTTLLSANTAVMPYNDDASTNNFNVTISGDTKPNNFNPYQGSYYSNLFDGTGDELTWSGTTIGSSQYTFECWFYLNVLSGTQAILGTTGSSGINIRVPSATVIQVDAYNNSGTQFTVPTMVVGQWYHLAVCRGASNLTTVFLNGTRSSTGTVGISTSYSSCSRIGASVDLNNFNGYISNARLVVGSSVYDPTQTTITVPTSPLTAIANTSLLTCQSNRFIDNSTNNFTITRNGDTRISGFIPFTPDTSYATYGSTYYDGTGDYLTLPAATSSLYLTGAFTFETWIYPISTGGLIYGNWNNQTGDPWAFFYSAGTFSSGFKIYFYRGNYGSNECALGSTTGLNLNAWNHFAVTRDASNNIYIFLNGVSLSLSTYTAALTWSNSFSFTNSSAIGVGGTPNYASFNGYISNLRFINGNALYTSAFTPNTTPLTAVANTQLLTCQSNQPVNNNVFLDEGTNNFLVTRNGNTTQGTFSPYGENWSNYFDGNGDYLSLADNTALAMGSGNWTLECWVYLNSYTGTTAYGFIYDGRPSGVNGYYLTLYQNNGVVRFFTNGSGVIGTDSGTTATLPVGQWTHIAVCKSGSSTKMFFNGSQVGSTYTDNNTYINGSGRPLIGANAITLGDYLNGYVSNLRLVKGTALYTANFTPSTTPLQPIANTSLLTCQDNRFIDDSPNNFTITRNGDVSVQKFGPFGQVTLPSPAYSVYFDGSGDYLRTTGSVLNNSAFTISFYFYPTSASVIGLFDSGPGQASTFRNYPANTIQDQNGGSVGFTANTNQWNWMSIVGDGSNFTVYLNGSSVGSAAYASLVDNNFTIGTINSGGDGNYAGYISNFRIKNIASVDAIPTSPLTAVANTTYLTCQSATMIDNSTNNFTITANGDSRPTRVNPFTLSYSLRQIYSPSVYGGSMYFDGTGDYLTSPAISSGNGTGLYLASSSFTVEAWLYQTAFQTTSGNVNTIVGDLTPTTATALWWVIGTDHTNAPVFRWYDGVVKTYTGSTALGIYRWNHVAFVCNAGTLSMYVNGILQTASGTSTITTPTGTQSNITIGADRGQYFTGYISDLRVIKGQALYTRNFVPPGAPVTAVRNTTLLLNGTTGGIISSSGQGNFETVGDAKLNTAITKFAGGTSMYFDGTGDYLVTYKNTNLYGASQYFTAECWVYVTNTGVVNGIMGCWDGSSGNKGWTLSCTGTFKLTIGSELFNSTWEFNSLGSITANTWTHVAFVRTLIGSNNNNRLFINGVSVLDHLDTAGDNRHSGVPAEGFPFAVGGTVGLSSSRFAGNTPTQIMNGYISDLRITKGVARYTSNFTPATSAFKQF